MHIDYSFGSMGKCMCDSPTTRNMSSDGNRTGYATQEMSMNNFKSQDMFVLIRHKSQALKSINKS